MGTTNKVTEALQTIRSDAGAAYEILDLVQEKLDGGEGAMALHGAMRLLEKLMHDAEHATGEAEELCGEADETKAVHQ